MAGLVHVKDVRLTLGATPLFTGVEFTLHKGERACLVGANGAGKSTLMRMLSGGAEPDGGEIAFAVGSSLGLVPQEPDLAGFATLRDYAEAPLGARGDATTPTHAAEAALESWGLDPDRPPEGMSGGEIRRAALARAFAAQPDILLLDEPTNHLDILAIEDLEERLARFRGACLVISHDRRFLERVSTATLWLRQGKVIRNNRGFAEFDTWAEQIETEEARALARLETHLRAEEHWLQRGVTARRSRNEGRRSRLMQMRAERRRQASLAAAPKALLEAEKGQETARLIIDAKGLSKTYDGKPIVSNLSVRVMRGDRLGLVGPNGAGKTTLLELLLGQREPDAGTIKRAANIAIAYVDQARAVLDSTQTMWDALAPGGGDQVMVRGKPKHIAAYAKDFLFTAAQLRQPVGALSGGERNRLALAVTLTKPADLLVLDEPTNDLDMDTLEALEEMLDDYDGTILIVSHDRAFLDGVATQILGAIAPGKWVETPGGWADFEREHGGFAQRNEIAKPKAAPAPTASAPKKIRKLSFKDEHRLTEIEALTPKLEAEIAKLDAVLADPDAFARDSAKFEAAAKRADAARREKDAIETEWLDIEARREALARDDA
jgi:ATP-binding cassette subfamily F protein uup